MKPAADHHWEWYESLSDGHDLWWSKCGSEYVVVAAPEKRYSGAKIYVKASGNTLDDVIQTVRCRFVFGLKVFAPGIEARQGGDNSVGSVEDESPTRREAPNTLHTHPNPKREDR